MSEKSGLTPLDKLRLRKTYRVANQGTPESAQSVDDLNKTTNLSFWTGTQIQYDALGAWSANTLYFIT